MYVLESIKNVLKPANNKGNPAHTEFWVTKIKPRIIKTGNSKPANSKAACIILGIFSRPIVVQDRNPHSYEADFMAEHQLYVQTKSFVSHIMENYINKTDENYLEDFPSSIKRLWIDLYENGFVEIDDVNSVILWLKALSDVGYKFPGKQNPVQIPSISKVSRNLFSGGKTLYELSANYMAKLYNGSSFLESECNREG